MTVPLGRREGKLAHQFSNGSRMVLMVPRGFTQRHKPSAGCDQERQVGLGSSNVLQPIALTGDLSIHGVGCQIDLTGPRNRTVINEHLTEELLIP